MAVGLGAKACFLMQPRRVVITRDCDTSVFVFLVCSCYLLVRLTETDREDPQGVRDFTCSWMVDLHSSVRLKHNAPRYTD
ncbi:hypothetical protein UPYG_G00214560 [Umbra pygmaea]|uniref:Uncharacterized protein n=1 Tax=Umbra pygmaea TaxID=75934 RepID=A0ABD0WKY5_UMBPY